MVVANQYSVVAPNSTASTPSLPTEPSERSPRRARSDRSQYQAPSKGRPDLNSHSTGTAALSRRSSVCTRARNRRRARPRRRSSISDSRGRRPVTRSLTALRAGITLSQRRRPPATARARRPADIARTRAGGWRGAAAGPWCPMTPRITQQQLWELASAAKLAKSSPFREAHYRVAGFRMGRTMNTERTAERILALRRTARRGGEIREELEPIIDGLRRELDETMTKAQAAKVIGVSVPTLDKWIEPRIIPVERAASGRPSVPRDTALDLVERVSDFSDRGR
jgi:hypothetical protein